MPGMLLDGLIFRQILAEVVVAEAGGVGEEMPQRDRALGRARARLAGGVETFQHLDGGDIGYDLGRWSVEIELALLDELHGACSRERLGHRRDPHDGISGHGRRLAEDPLAVGPFIDDRVPIGGHCDDAGHIAGIDRTLQQRVDLVHACCSTRFGMGLSCGARITVTFRIG